MKNTKNGTVFTYRNGTQWLTRFNGTTVRWPLPKSPSPRSPPKSPNKPIYTIIGPGKWIKNNPTRYQNVENLLSQNLGLSWVGNKLGRVYSNNKYGNYVVLNKNSKVIGYSLIRNMNPSLEIVAIGTNRSTRGTGIGKSLMNRIKNNYKTAGYRRIFLNSILPAMGFYNKMGFATHPNNSFKRHFNLTKKTPRKSNNPKKRPRS